MNLALALSLLFSQDPDLQKVQELQQKLRDVVEKVKPAYVFFGNGSGVCISFAFQYVEFFLRFLISMGVILGPPTSGTKCSSHSSLKSPMLT